jgi:hypothetical protein
MINSNNYTQKERLEIVLDIMNKLKKFKLNNGDTIDLYNSDYSFVKEFKLITSQYIKDGNAYNGILDFKEIQKKIEYSLPQKNYKKSLFVIRIKN